MPIVPVTGDQLALVRRQYPGGLGRPRQWSDSAWRPSWQSITDAAGAIAGFASMGSMELALGRRDILTPAMRRKLVAHRDRNLTRTDMPRRRPRSTNYTRAAKRRKLTGRSNPGRFQVGYYGRFNQVGKFAGEDKFHDTVIVNSTFGLTEQKTNICVIPQNNTENGRIGRKIRISSIAMHCQIKKGSTVTADEVQGHCKLSWILDKQTNGTTYPTLTRLKADTITSFNNLANSHRFETLKSKVYNLQAAGGAPITIGDHIWGEQQRWVKWYQKCDHIIEYDASATDGSIATQRSNTIWFAIIASMSPGFVIDHATIRVRFRDA